MLLNSHSVKLNRCLRRLSWEAWSKARILINWLQSGEVSNAKRSIISTDVSLTPLNSYSRAELTEIFFVVKAKYIKSFCQPIFSVHFERNTIAQNLKFNAFFFFSTVCVIIFSFLCYTKTCLQLKHKQMNFNGLSNKVYDLHVAPAVEENLAKTVSNLS